MTWTESEARQILSWYGAQMMRWALNPEVATKTQITTAINRMKVLAESLPDDKADTVDGKK